jgi:uncharacterized protein YhaN
VAAARRGLALALGDGPEADGLRRALATGDLAAWADGATAAEGEVARLAAEAEDRARAVGARERELADLEASADVPRLAAEAARRAAELADGVRRFREAALLERLLRDALEEYRREKQPAVLRNAGEAFARITGGRYVRVLQAAQPGALEVLDRDGRALPVEALSRGTREQLYVAVRLGLAAAVAARGTRLPLLLDDVLVNFDPARARETALVLAAFARDHQVLFFTCHPATEALLAAAAPGAPVLHLTP